MDIELQAYRASVQQLSQDFGNLVLHRNILQVQLQTAQSELDESRKTVEARDITIANLKADIDELHSQIDELREDRDSLAADLDASDKKADSAVRYMDAENALAYSVGADPVPANHSDR